MERDNRIKNENAINDFLNSLDLPDTNNNNSSNKEEEDEKFLKEAEELYEICQPVINYLRNKYGDNPHCGVEITPYQVRLIEDVFGFQIDEDEDNACG